jgi:hypothetical protein
VGIVPPRTQATEFFCSMFHEHVMIENNRICNDLETCSSSGMGLGGIHLVAKLEGFFFTNQVFCWGPEGVRGRGILTNFVTRRCTDCGRRRHCFSTKRDGNK